LLHKSETDTKNDDGVNRDGKKQGKPQTVTTIVGVSQLKMSIR